MTEQEYIMLQEVNEYLSHPLDPTSEDYNQDILNQMAGWLMSYAPGRYRLIANRLITAPQEWVIRDANDRLSQVARSLANYGNVQQVAAAIPSIVEKAVEAVTQTSVVVAEANKQASSHAGKRPDHDSLPEEIRALYEENLPILQKQRSMFEKMKLYYQQMKDQQTSASSAPCDIEETCHQLQLAAKEVVALNDRRIENWQKYDNYQAEEPKEEAAPVQSNVADEPQLNLSTDKAYISRYLPRLEELWEDPTKKAAMVKQRKEIQKRVDKLEAMGWDATTSKWCKTFDKVEIRYTKKS